MCFLVLYLVCLFLFKFDSFSEEREREPALVRLGQAGQPAESLSLSLSLSENKSNCCLSVVCFAFNPCWLTGALKNPPTHWVRACRAGNLILVYTGQTVNEGVGGIREAQTIKMPKLQWRSYALILGVTDTSSQWSPWSASIVTLPCPHRRLVSTSKRTSYKVSKINIESKKKKRNGGWVNRRGTLC